MDGVTKGSPPRVRGTVGVGLQAGIARRITPARAGNRLRKGIKTGLKKDHPRACGEQVKFACCNTSTAGSPPRVRGTVAV